MLKKTFLLIQVCLVFICAHAQSTKTIQIDTIHIEAYNENIDKKYVVETFDEEKHSTLGEVLFSESELYLKNYGRGNLSSISLNGGSSNQTSVVWNTMELNSSFVGQQDLSLINFIHFDEIGINTNDLMYRTSGVLELNNKMNEEEDFVNLQMLGSVGSFNTYKTGAKLKLNQGRWTSSTSLSIASSKNMYEYDAIQDGIEKTLLTDDADYEDYQLFTENTLDINEDVLIKGGIWYSKNDRKLVPNYLFLPSIETLDSRYARTYAGLVNNTGNSINELILSFSYEDLTYNNATFLFKTRSIANTYQAAFNNEFKMGQGKLFLNAKWANEWGRSNNFETNAERNKLNGLVAYKHYSKYFNFHPGIAVNWNDLDKAYYLPSLEIETKPGKSWYLNLHGSKRLNIPTLNDLFWGFGGNLELESEKSWNFNWRLNHVKRHGDHLKVDFGLNQFNNWVEDKIVWFADELNFFSPINISETRVNGLTLNVSPEYKRNEFHAKLNISYTYTHATDLSTSSILDLSKSALVPYVPEHRMGNRLQLFYDHYKIALEHNLIGERFTIRDNSQTLPEVNLFNFLIGAEFKLNEHRLGANILVENIFGEQYELVAYYPTQGRYIELQLLFDLFEGQRK